MADVEHLRDVFPLCVLGLRSLLKRTVMPKRGGELGNLKFYFHHMASFSTLSKTYAKDKLSQCATTVLLVCCYLYHKRSNTNNINAEAKEQDRDMQTPVDDSGIFTEVSRSVQASP